MMREAPALAKIMPALCACYIYVAGRLPTVVRRHVKARRS
jgi:hypothetical protein